MAIIRSAPDKDFIRKKLGKDKVQLIGNYVPGLAKEEIDNSIRSV